MTTRYLEPFRQKVGWTLVKTKEGTKIKSGNEKYDGRWFRWLIEGSLFWLLKKRHFKILEGEDRVSVWICYRGRTDLLRNGRWVEGTRLVTRKIGFRKTIYSKHSSTRPSVQRGNFTAKVNVQTENSAVKTGGPLSWYDQKIDETWERGV